MILQLLKKLRTTLRTPTNTVNTLTLIGHTSRETHSRIPTWVQRGVAVAVLSLMTSPAVFGQQFRPPAQPEAPQINLNVVQAKFQHAEALRRQMERVATEQRAPDGFAQQAYAAQQAYLAELAYDEYRAYAKKLDKEQKAKDDSTSPAVRAPRKELASSQVSTFRSPSMTMPSYAGQSRTAAPAYSASTAPNVPTYTGQQVGFEASRIQEAETSQAVFQPPRHQQPVVAAPIQPNRYAPPVHVAPKAIGVSMSFGDSETSQEPLQQNQTSISEPARHNPPAVMARPMDSYQAPRQIPARKQPASGPPLPLNHHQLGMTPRTPQPRPTAQRIPVVQRQDSYVQQASLQTEMQQAVANVTRAQHQSDARPERRVLVRDERQHQPPTQVYEVPTSTQRKQRSFILDDQNVGLQDKIASFLSKPEYKKTSVGQTDVASQPTPAPARVSKEATRLSKSPTIASPTLATQTSPLDRMASVQSKSVQQVSMTAPVQEPFAPPEFEVPEIHESPTLNGPRTAYQSADQFRQISILNGQERENNGFQPSQLPAPGTTQGDDEIQRIDQELKQQMEALEQKRNQLRNQGSEAAEPETQRVDSLVRDLEQGVDDEMQENESSGLNDSLRANRNRPKQKSCEDFRSQLLASSIRDIALDVSPRASSYQDQYTAISRSWTDRNGQVIATGTMTDLRRGYVVIDGEDGSSIKLPYFKLSDADLAAISEYWRIPDTCTVGGVGIATRCWTPQTYTWKATSLCHKPLYFENIQLERYGHTHGPFTQPVHSVAHFFTSLVAVPWQTSIHPPNECEYALGFYRPGDCAPWLKDPIPFSLSGMSRQALFVTGAAVIP